MRTGVSNGGVDRTVVEDGTMIWSGDLFPTFGYNPGREFRSDTYGLFRYRRGLDLASKY